MKILGEFGSDYMTLRYDFLLNFMTTVPERKEWRNGAAHLARDFVQISKL